MMGIECVVVIWREICKIIVLNGVRVMTEWQEEREKDVRYQSCNLVQ
jgi:hypothetical protein